MVQKLTALCIFLVPMASLIPMPGTIVWYPQYLALIILGFCVASYYIWQVNKPLGALSLYCLYSYIFVCHQHPRSMFCLVICYGGIGFICLLSQLKETSIIFKSLIGIALLQFVLVVLQKFNLDPFFHLVGSDNLADTVGLLGSHNQLGAYYAAVAPILLHFCLPLILISFLAIFFTSCTSTAIGALVGLGTYLFFMNSRLLLILMIPIVITALVFWSKFDVPRSGLSERMKVWQLTLKQSVEGKAVLEVKEGVNRIVTWNPLTGAGIGSFIMISPSSQFGILKDVRHRYEHAHNDLVEFFNEFGWLGLPILLWLILDIVFKFLTCRKENVLVLVFASLVAQAVSSMGVYIIHAPVSYFMLCLMLGLFYREVNHARICRQEA